MQFRNANIDNHRLQALVNTRLCLRVLACLTFGLLSLAAGAANLTGISIAPVNPAVGVGAVQPFTATGTFDDSTTRLLSAGTETRLFDIKPGIPVTRASGAQHDDLARLPNQ
jgi:hypothetical protein